MNNRIKRPNWYDFQRVTLEDLNAEQSSYLAQIAETNRTVLGTGVRLDFPQEPIIFDSENLSLAQAGYVAVSTFDGRGVLAESYFSKDTSNGSQLNVRVSDARLAGYVALVITVIGKLFDGTLVYEHLVFNNNISQITKNHFKEVVNILFQNFRGNTNTSVDGVGCFNVGGRVVITEASSLLTGTDCIASQFTAEPDVIFRDYKVYDPGKALQTVLEEALGSSNSLDDLNINTTSASTRTFVAGASTEVIYGQKFKFTGNNIQKISLLIGLQTGTSWSGSLVLEIRPLLTSTTCPTDFLPNNEIEFDPDTAPIESISLDQSDLAERGVVLSALPQIVDFIFTDTTTSNPLLSKLVPNTYYVITLRRTGSTATGTIFLNESRNDDSLMRRLTVFQNGVWTDVPDSTLWYIVWNDSIRIANGVAYDQGTHLVVPKTILNNNGVYTQFDVSGIQLANTSEGAENYVIVQKTLGFTDVEIHPRTGDSIYSREEDAPTFSTLQQTDVLNLLNVQKDLIVLSRVIDNNPRSNPTISGTLDYPGLALNNVINIINPGPDLLTQNVVGSLITPNVLKPTLRYRIIKQDIITDLLGDINGDGIIDVIDANKVSALDGYHLYLSGTGTYSQAQQKTLIELQELNILELLRAQTDDSDGQEITSADFLAVNNFILNGTAYPIGASSFTRVRLEVEPVENPKSVLDSDANSTLSLESLDTDLLNPSNFSLSTGITFEIKFVSTWLKDNISVLDLRRFVNTAFIEFDSENLLNSPESGGSNNFLISGDLYLRGEVKHLDGTYHHLDFEKNVIEIELPSGDTEGRVNIFDKFVMEKMRFSDGSPVPATALIDDQVRFEVAISSHVKNLTGPDGYLDFDGYVDGYGEPSDESIGTYMDHLTGILRIRAYNIVRNQFFPEIRTRITVAVSLKKAGFKDPTIYVTPTDLAGLIEPIT